MLGAVHDEYQWLNISHGNYVCQLLMEWLTHEDATLHIGGAGQYASQYNQAAQVNPFSLDDLYFYDMLLTSEQIQAAYREQAAARADNHPLSGDMDGNGTVDLEDAQLALKCVLKIMTIHPQQILRADIDQNGAVDLTDVQLILKKALKIIP